MIKLGIMNYVTDGFRWRHLIFYEKDTEITKAEIDKIHTDMAKAKSAYVSYTTASGGYHVMGLTPVSTIVWAYAFKDLDMDLRGNTSGHVLRCNLKPDEKQELIRIGNIHDFPVCDQIYNMARVKWDMESYYLKGVEVQKWKSLFCVYNETQHLSHRLQPFKRLDKDKKRVDMDRKPEGTLSRITPSHVGMYQMEKEI